MFRQLDEDPLGVGRKVGLEGVLSCHLQVVLDLGGGHLLLVQVKLFKNTRVYCFALLGEATLASLSSACCV